MKIYTKRGDEGETGLYGGDRVPKDNLRIRAYGTLDELNAVLGMSLAPVSGTDTAQPPLSDHLRRIQGELFQLGAELATPRGKTLASAVVDQTELSRLETEIDEMEKTLSPLKSFILPGGSRLGSELHLARTVCRRAEREIVVLHRAEPLRPLALQYMNRLSDYLFVAARFANHIAQIADIPWHAPK